jgi:hypothetical protein
MCCKVTLVIACDPALLSSKILLFRGIRKTQTNPLPTPKPHFLPFGMNTSPAKFHLHGHSDPNACVKVSCQFSNCGCKKFKQKLNRWLEAGDIIVGTWSSWDIWRMPRTLSRWYWTSASPTIASEVALTLLKKKKTVMTFRNPAFG